MTGLNPLFCCFASFVPVSSTSMASEWLNKWMVSLSRPKMISLQMGHISGRLVTFTKLIFSSSMLSKFGLQHKGHGSTFEHILGHFSQRNSGDSSTEGDEDEVVRSGVGEALKVPSGIFSIQFLAMKIER